MKSYKNYYNIIRAAIVLAWCVVMMGAYTRLTDAGLGCPDWPGCYGAAFAHKMAHPEIHLAKAWTEMIHRYMAGVLAVFVLCIFAMPIRYYQDYFCPKLLPLLLMITVIFQALLGMWTVTWKLLPEVVTLHLVGGMTLLALLWCLRLQIRGNYTRIIDRFAVCIRAYVWIGLFLLIVQILLGAWVSTNYAALSCGNDFPKCHGVWHFPTHLSQLFVFSHFGTTGIDYTGGLLSIEQRMNLHMAHRFWAMLVAIYWSLLSLMIIIKSTQLRMIAFRILCLLWVQILLGILNVLFLLPLLTAVLHNGVAALLLLAVITLVYASSCARNTLNT